MEKEIILTNWHHSNPIIYNDDLGWSKDDYRDAESNNPETVFNYFWRHYNSIVFYYVPDGNFYELFMEGSPFKFWKIQKKKEWDGKWICDLIDWNDHVEGEVLFTFNDNTDVWTDLRLNGIPIGEVLQNSVIAEINI